MKFLLLSMVTIVLALPAHGDDKADPAKTKGAPSQHTGTTQLLSESFDDGTRPEGPGASVPVDFPSPNYDDWDYQKTPAISRPRMSLDPKNKTLEMHFWRSTAEVGKKDFLNKAEFVSLKKGRRAKTHGEAEAICEQMSPRGQYILPDDQDFEKTLNRIPEFKEYFLEEQPYLQAISEFKIGGNDRFHPNQYGATSHVPAALYWIRGNGDWKDSSTTVLSFLSGSRESNLVQWEPLVNKAKDACALTESDKTQCKDLVEKTIQDSIDREELAIDAASKKMEDNAPTFGGRFGYSQDYLDAEKQKKSREAKKAVRETELARFRLGQKNSDIEKAYEQELRARRNQFKQSLGKYENGVPVYCVNVTKGSEFKQAAY